jgi:hypothetical protein
MNVLILDVEAVKEENEYANDYAKGSIITLSHVDCIAPGLPHAGGCTATVA